LKRVLDVESKEKLFVSTVVKKVTLLKVKVVQPEVKSAASVVNMTIMLAVAKGEGTQSLENKAPPNNGEADSSVVVMGDRPIKLRIIVTFFAFTINGGTDLCSVKFCRASDLGEHWWILQRCVN